MFSSLKFVTATAVVAALSTAVALFALTASSDAGSSQKEFGKKRRYDATQCVAVDEELMIVKKKKFLAVFAENKCSRPIHALACYTVTKPTLKQSRTGWYCDYREYKSRSRTMISDRAEYGRTKKWAACNVANEDCIRILKSTDGNVNASGQDPEAVAKRMR